MSGDPIFVVVQFSQFQNLLVANFRSHFCCTISSLTQPHRPYHDICWVYIVQGNVLSNNSKIDIYSKIEDKYCSMLDAVSDRES